MKKFFKIFKQELISIPLIILGFYLFNYLLTALFPKGIFFDPNSQIENLFWWATRVIFGICLVWLVLAIAFPPVLYSFHEDIYLNFKNLSKETRLKITIWLVITVFVFVALIGSAKASERDNLKVLLDSQLNIRTDANNRNPEVDKMLLNVGIKPPNEWCAAYCSWDLDKIGVKNPHSAWSPNFALAKDIIWKPKRKINTLPLLGDCFTLYYASLGRVGHTGFYYSTDKSGYFIIQAGNTTGEGSRHGDRVGRKKADPEKIYAISRYIKP